MKRAYMMLARKNINQIVLLVEALTDKDIDIYIHVDKANHNLYHQLLHQYRTHSNVLISKRINDDLMFIDWEHARKESPKTLTCEDLEALKTSPKLMARKFDIDVDERVLFDINQELLGAGGSIDS